MDRHVGKEGVVLEHHADVSLLGIQSHHIGGIKQDVTGRRRLEAGDAAQRGSLAAAARPEKRDQLVIVDFQVDGIDGRNVAETLNEPVYGKFCHGKVGTGGRPMTSPRKKRGGVLRGALPDSAAAP